MLDVGFSEILLTSAIALIVLGPERLPKVARQVGNWMGRARAMARQLSEQLEREVSADELMKAQTKSAAAKTAGPANKNSSPADTPPQGSAGTPVQGSAATSSAASPSQATAAAVNAPPPGVYSPHDTGLPGADWHANPPDSKPGNG